MTSTGGTAAGPAVTVTAVTYLVTAWPADLAENPDASTWCVQVQWRGRDRWAVTKGHGTGGPYLDAGLTWSHGPADDDEEEAWRAAHRFGRERALELASAMAPVVTIMGMTTLECIAWHRERGHGEIPASPDAPSRGDEQG